MKNIFKVGIWLFLGALIIANIAIFVSSLNLSDQTTKYEEQANILHTDNLSLQAKLSSLSSLKFAEDKAVALNFTQKETPIFLNDKLGVAFNYRP